MPTPSQMRLPRPTSDDEFEEICADVLSQKYGASFQRFGRKGQSQNGIDLYSNDFRVVAQCKNHQNYSHIVEEIKSDYNNATKHFQLQKFIVATSLSRDTNTQTLISNIAQNIEILFWEDIEQIICNNNDLLKKHYPTFSSLNSQDIPIAVLNDVIQILDVLSSNAKHIKEQYTNYSPCYHYDSDVALYNICVKMSNASCELYQHLSHYNIQFYRHKLSENIHYIIDSLPDFHDASNDLIGTELTVTIFNFLQYFCNEENSTNYVSLCQDVINNIYKLTTST